MIEKRIYSGKCKKFGAAVEVCSLLSSFHLACCKWVNFASDILVFYLKRVFFPPAISAEPDGKKIGKNNLLALQKQVVAVGIQMYFAYLKHTKPF